MNTTMNAPTQPIIAPHTPTPWRAVSCTTREGFTIAQAPVNARGEQNVAIAANIAQLGNNSADAAFIVRAVNAHAQLVAALEAARDLLDQQGIYIVNEAGGLIGSTCAKIEAAIDLANES